MVEGSEGFEWRGACFECVKGGEMLEVVWGSGQIFRLMGSFLRTLCGLGVLREMSICCLV